MSRAYEDFLREREHAERADDAPPFPLQADDDAIFAAHPPARVAAEIGRRRRARVVNARSSLLRTVLTATTAFACAAAFVVMAAPPTERAKGGDVGLGVWRRAGERAERLANGDGVRPGDLVQLTVSAGGHTHGVVVALDGAGRTSLVFPASANDDTRLPGGAGALDRALDDALEVDAAPGFERFVLVVADAPLAPHQVLAAARSLADDAHRARTAPLSLPEGTAQASIVLVKEAP